MNQSRWADKGCGNIARFQITVLVQYGSERFWLVTVLLIICPRSLLLCPFHKKLGIWWKKSFGFCQTDNSRSSFYDVLLFNRFKCLYLSRTYFSKSASFLKSVFHVTHIIMTKTVTAQGGASNWNPYRKWYQPDWRCYIHIGLGLRGNTFIHIIGCVYYNHG